MIKFLRILKFGQQVRDDGPKSHLKKSNTPMQFTMAMWMQVVIIPFLVSFTCVWLIHPAIAKMAIIRGLTDNPNARKLQKADLAVEMAIAQLIDNGELNEENGTITLSS